jgi:Leucine-rich repeat (LRR) protein
MTPDELIEEARRLDSTGLDLSSNQLTAISEALAQLTNLQDLNLSSNQLTAIPEALAQLTNLQSLNLSGNQLTVIPEALAQLTKLHRLDLRNNHLTAIPETVESTTLATVAYDKGRGLLQLEFRSRAIYQYFGVTAAVHEALLGAPSNRFIRGRFPYSLASHGQGGVRRGSLSQSADRRLP